VSMACAEQALLPAVRAADPDTLVLADGFSCRTQIAQAGTGRRALHLAEVLLATVDGETSPEARLAGRSLGEELGRPRTRTSRLRFRAIGL
jgi:hypothetical protein